MVELMGVGNHISLVGACCSTESDPQSPWVSSLLLGSTLG